MRTLPAILFFVALCLHGTANAQSISFDRGYALVFPKNGIGFTARSLQIYGDSIIFLSPEMRVLAKSDISKLMVRNEKPRANGIGVGAIIGVYAMHYAAGRATNQPGAFLSYNQYASGDNASIIWITLLGAALGGGVGYLTEASPSCSYLTPYVFAGGTDIINEQWRLFVEEAGVVTQSPRFHVTLSGGNVSTPTTDGYHKMLEANGFDQFDQPYYSDFFFPNNDDGFQKATTFNWLRKAEFEYSVTDNIRTGLAFTWLSEPVLYARKGDPPFSSSNMEIYEFLQRVDGKGYYATGGYHYYLTKKKDIEVNAKIGVGMADMNHEIKAWYRRNSSDEATEAVIADTKKYFSFICSGGIGYSIYPNLTLSLTANYFNAGSAVMDEIFIIDVPPMDVTYSTTDVGFSIAMHF